MLDPNLEKHLVARYLRPDYEIAESDFACKQPTLDEAKAIIHELRNDMDSCSVENKIKRATEMIEELASQMRQRIPFDTSEIAKECIDEIGIKLSKKDQQSLGMQLLHARREFLEAYKVALMGNWSPFKELKTHNDEHAEKKYISFGKLVDKYKKWYRANNSHVKSIDSAVIPECDVLVEIIGSDKDAQSVNRPECVTELRLILSKYPKNKTKIFKKKSIHSILRNETNYARISTTTANKYIHRLTNIIEYAKEHDYLDGNNRAKGKTIPEPNVLPSDKRDEYSQEDILKLIDAICTKPMGFKVVKPERFWIILIGLFHGFRTGNIVALTKTHIVQDRQGRFCFDLSKFRSNEAKTTSTREVFTPIDPLLLDIGFMNWVESHNPQKLFTDSVNTFSRFYNRNEKTVIIRSDGTEDVKIIFQGFEPRYITDEPNKCFYSTRHTFVNVAAAANIESRVSKSMTGHAQDRKDTHNSTYLKNLKSKTIASNQIKLDEEFINEIGIDVDRLRNRAIELFNLSLSERL